MTARSMRHLCGFLLCLALFALELGTVRAQEYPSKPIQFIVPAPAGGGVDILARAIGQKITESWGIPVVVEDRPGAGGSIGTALIAKAAPDGYTITLGTIGTHAVNVSLYKKLPYDPVRDFAPVILVAMQPNLLVVHPSLPVRSVKELIALAKSRPGQLNYASSGNGGPPHLAAELFKAMAHVDMVHVPYKGGPPGVNDVLSGQVPLTFGTILNTLPHVKAGKLRGLAVTGAKRSPALPDMPTIAESGVPGYEVNAWYGVLAPAGTTTEIVIKLNSEIGRILRLPEVRARLANQGAEIVGSTPEQFAAHIKAEIVKWAKVVKDSGMKVD